MALNPDKSDTIIIGTHQRSSSYSSLASVDVAGSAVPLADHIKVLGVTLETGPELNFGPSRQRGLQVSVLSHQRTWRRPSLAHKRRKHIEGDKETLFLYRSQ